MSSKLGLLIRQRYSVPGGPDETHTDNKYPLHALSRVSREDLLIQKMRELASQRAAVRGRQKFTGGLYGDGL